MIDKNLILYPNDWKPIDIDILYEDIFQNETYDKLFEINDNDIIVDLGSNIGFYTLNVLNRNPNIEKIYIIEAQRKNFSYTFKNVLKLYPELLYKCIFLNIGISGKDDIGYIGDGVSPFLSKSGKKVQLFSLINFIKKYNLPRIDILKFDIEGSELDMFYDDESLEYIFKNVNKLVGELHPSRDKQKSKLYVDIIKKFIDNNYNVELKSIDLYDIKNSYLNNLKLNNNLYAWEYYNEIIFYAKKNN